MLLSASSSEVAARRNSSALARYSCTWIMVTGRVLLPLATYHRSVRVEGCPVDDQPVSLDLPPHTPTTIEPCGHFVLIHLEHLDAIPTHVAYPVDPLLDCGGPGLIRLADTARTDEQGVDVTFGVCLSPSERAEDD